MLEVALVLALARPPAPLVTVQDQSAVVRVQRKARRYHVQIRPPGGSWSLAATSVRRRVRLNLDPGRYRVRAQVKGKKWSKYGKASGWFTIVAGGTAPGPTPTPTPTTPPADYPGRKVWVDPVAGNDDADGSRGAPLRSLTEAWARIPSNVPEAIVISVLPGTVTSSPNYWENRRGQPIAIVAANGPGTAAMTEDINMYRVDNLTIDGLRIHRNGDVFHCEQCRHIALVRVDFDGGGAAHETIKVNQSQYFDILDSRITGTYENAIDFVAVQWATIAGNDISNGTGDTSATDWCAYVKGGSAHIEVRNNVIHDCGTGGFTAGQGTGFEYMVAPWLTYEAQDVVVRDNLIHDTYGAGLGVNGGRHIRMFGNVLVRVGSRSHTVEFVHGARSCDGDLVACQAHHDAGGWGGVGIDGQYIPNQDVWFGNNVIANSPGQGSQWSQVAVAGPVVPPVGSNVPSPSRADEGLVIVNNIFWNQTVDDGWNLAGNRVNSLDPQINPTTLRPAVTLPPVAVPE